MKINKYGIPYCGSRDYMVNDSHVLDLISDFLPKAKNFYDLFCGGLSVTDYMMENNKYEHYYANDKNSQIINSIVACLKYHDYGGNIWMSPENHKMLNKTYHLSSYTTLLCFSLLARTSHYVYQDFQIPFKYALHEYIFNSDNTYINKLADEVIDIHIQSDIESRHKYIFDYILKNQDKFNKYIYKVEDSPLHGMVINNNNTFIKMSFELDSILTLENYNMYNWFKIFDSKKRDFSKLHLTKKDYRAININNDEDGVIYIDAPYHCKYQYSVPWDQLEQWMSEQHLPIYVMNDNNLPETKYEKLLEIPYKFFDLNDNKYKVYLTDALYRYKN